MASAEASVSPSGEGETGMSPGEFALKKLFAEFVALGERKLQLIATQPLEYPLAKSLQRGEDPHFDQLLNALNEVASFCLRSILAAIFRWRDMEIQQVRSNATWSTVPTGEATDSPYPASKREKEYLIERQELAIEFIFCLVLIEVLAKLAVHPIPESFIHTIEDLAFRHFKQQESLKERTGTNPNIQSSKKIADLYAEVIGVLSQSRFHSVRKRFFHEIRDPQNNSTTTINIIEGMSFVRVKMFPVEELEGWFAFLQECATYFLECNREKIKHAMSSLFVEILLPVAAVINLEASLPVVRKFVGMLYSHAFEQAKRARHSSAYIPLVTVLLSVSESQFFLNIWNIFLVQTILPNLKRGDSKVQRTALEALYRLVWVYMVRIKGESNITTFARLRLIVESLFPRGQRGVQPKDMPLNIFVKLIQFIASERLEYTMNEVVLELLSLGRTKTNINPERMIVGLRAFLVIADSREKKEGDPMMPLNVGPLPSGGPYRQKTKFLSNTLTDETARKIGIATFYPHIRKALDGILRALDHSIGRSLTATNMQATGKSSEELLSGVKPKLDLLKTCVAAIPRIMPEAMGREDLIDLLSRLTIHLDHELVRTAVISLQNIITNFPTWRHDVMRVFALFILRDIPDSCPLVLEAALKMLLQFSSHWRTLIAATPEKESAPTVPSTSMDEPEMYCIPWVEACALVALCSYRSVTRRYSLVLLKEIRSLHDALSKGPRAEAHSEESAVMDIVEKATPNIIKRYLATLSVKERTELRLLNHSLNMTWMADRSACFLEQGGSRNSLRDAWTQCLAGLLEPHLLPETCSTAVHIAWPYAYNRMIKAYNVLDPAGVGHEKGDRPASLKARRPVISSLEMFLWRNYLIFVSCSAPPSTNPSLMSSGDSSILEGSGRFSHLSNARDLFRKMVPLIRSEGEIREVVITALGLVHPLAFGDLVEELHSHIHDALDQKKGDNPRKKRKRETLRVQISRVFALTAEHGCFRHSPMTRTEKGEVSIVLLEFIEGIKNYLESEMDRSMPYLQELRTHFAALVANIINSLPKGPQRYRLFTPEMRYNLFYLYSNWCGLFRPTFTDTEQEIRSRNRTLSFNSLEAMSALLCCGPVFHSKGLDKDSSLYHWLDNMLSSSEPRVQTLGRKTVQMLLQNNSNVPTLLNWVIDHCYDSKVTCAQLCFHALSNTLSAIPVYPCDMVTVLHVVLYKTADTDPSTRERATQLLQLLDRRFFTSSDSATWRAELMGCLTAGAYSQAHVALSKELAHANPELTLPMFCEMVYRFEMAPRSGQGNLLQYMVPWLRNVELVGNESRHQPSRSHHHAHFQMDEFPQALPEDESGNPVLLGSGWGSMEGTRVVLHNLLYLTAKYGDDYLKEVENLWCALCTWPSNIRITLNYLARLTCVAGNTPLMLQQAKRIMVCFSRRQARAIVSELMKELQSVEMLSADLQVMDKPPFYQLHSTGLRPVAMETELPLFEGVEGSSGWAITWRLSVRMHEGRGVPLPMPPGKQYYASMREMLKVPSRQLAPLHRCNFALILLSELVMELSDIDWSPHIPLLLHVTLLGLNVFPQLIYEHSKKLLGNLVVVLACRNDKMAALQARFAQQELSLRSPSSGSLASLSGDTTTSKIVRMPSIDSLIDSSTYESSLSEEARDLICFISSRDSHRPPWPFADLSAARLHPNSDVHDLTLLVSKILAVFRHVLTESPEPLKEKWAQIALQWATSCSSHQYASQSFQVCRALELPLSSRMFHEMLTRLAESASDMNEDMQSYVMEIILTLESAVDHVEDDDLQPSNISMKADTSRKTSDLAPLPSDLSGIQSPLSPPPSTDSGASVKRKHSRGRSMSSRAEIMARPSSAKARVDSPSQLQLACTSPNAAQSLSGATREAQVHSPLHTKAATVVGTSYTDGPTPTKSHPSLSSTFPESAWKSSTPISAQQSKEVAKIPEGVKTPIATSPSAYRLSPEHGHVRAVTDSAAIGPDTRLLKDTKPRELPVKEIDRSRKSSEPPPSLLALFDHDMASSRRTMIKQISADFPVHPRQTSLDNSQLKPVPLSSPKHGRRLKSPSTSKSTIHRAPSHPHLNSATSSPQVSHSGLPPIGQPLFRARSTQQLKVEVDANEASLKRRSYSGGKEDMHQLAASILKRDSSAERPMRTSSGDSKKDTFVGMRKTPSRESLRGKEIKTSPGSSGKDARVVGPKETSKDRSISGSLLKEPQTVVKEISSTVEVVQAPLVGVPGGQGSPSKQHGDVRRRNSTGLKRDSLDPQSGGRRIRPRSMIETSSMRSTSASHSLDVSTGAPDLLAQLFWTASGLLESDYEGEFTMALRLLSKTMDRLDLTANDTCDRLEALLTKLKWPRFPGVQALLMKGLTLESTSEATRTILSRVTLYSTKAVFDPTQYAGLPLNIMALMPVLVYHFNSPNDFCLSVVSSIQRACDLVELPSEDCKTKLIHMSKMFQMYATKEFTNGCDVWLAGICRYINDAYMSLAGKILTLLVDLLEKGCHIFHRPVLRLLYEYMKLQEPKSRELKVLADSIITLVTQHLKGPLWKEALDLLKLAVSTSASLVRPPTRGLPVVDLGLFNQTLPGPTLQFSVDLQPGSADLNLAQEPTVTSTWKKPHQCQRRTRERLLSVLNACVPVPVLMSSPSVVFTDDQALIGDKATLYSSASEEAASIASVKDEIPDTSQPESQVYITAVGDEFNFLDFYDSSSESETPGPFSRSFQALVDQYREDEREDSSPLSGSHSSLGPGGSETEEQIAEEEDIATEEEDEQPVPSEEVPEDVRYYSTEEPSVLEVRGQYGPPETVPSGTLTPAEEPEKEVEEISVGEKSQEGERVSLSQDIMHLSGSAGDEDIGPRLLEHVVDLTPSEDVTGEQEEVEHLPIEVPSPQKEAGLSPADRSPHSVHLSPAERSPHSVRLSPAERSSHSMKSSESGEKPLHEGSEEPKGAQSCEDSFPEMLQLTQDSLDEPRDENMASRDEEKPHDQEVGLRDQEVKSDDLEVNLDEQEVQSGGQEGSPDQELGLCAEEVGSHGEHARQASPEKKWQREDEKPPDLIQARPGLSQERPGLSQEQPGLSQDRLELSQERLGLSQERPGLSQERPGFSQERPGLSQERPGLSQEAHLSQELPCLSEQSQKSFHQETEAMEDEARGLDDDLGPRIPERVKLEEPTQQPEDGSQREKSLSLSSVDLLAEETSEQVQPEASRFISVAHDKIIEKWQDHVSKLGRLKSGKVGVHTHYLFHRLFLLIRQQFCQLTQEACNYLGENYRAIASHFLVTVELLFTQFELPKVYIDAKLLCQSNLLEQHVFLTLEMQENLSSYMERRSTVLECLNHFQLSLRQSSLLPTSPPHTSPLTMQALSPQEAALKLCRAVHRLHFQLLVLMGSYVKLVGILRSALQGSGTVDLSHVLSEAKRSIDEGVLVSSRGPSPPLDEGTQQEVQGMSMEEAMQTVENALIQKECIRAIQLIHSLRQCWHGVEVFGESEDDDADCLFYIYARYIADTQGGVLCITETGYELSEVHSRLMAQNISLHTLLDSSQDTLHPLTEVLESKLHFEG